MNGNKITGLHGCACHPFDSWKECDKAHRKRFKVGDKVKNRHSDLIGSVYEVEDYKGFYSVKYGPLPRDIHLEHAANIMAIN